MATRYKRAKGKFRGKGNRFKGRFRGSRKFYPTREVELKSIDIGGSASEIDNTGVYILLNGLSMGSGMADRTGRIIYMKSMEIRGFWTGGASMNTYQGICRMILFYDKQSNGAEPAADDVIYPAEVEGLRNLANRSRFKIIKDETWKVSTSGNPDAQKPFHWYVQLPGQCQKSVYNAGDAGTVADIETGSLYLLLITDTSAGTNTEAMIDYNIRVRFYDA